MFELQCVMFYYEKKRYLTFTSDSRESINRLINGYGMSTYEPAFFSMVKGWLEETKCWQQGHETSYCEGILN